MRVPIHYVPGNHDILQQRFEKTKEAYIKNIGGLLTQAEYDGVKFIFIYCEPLAQSFAVSGYEPLRRLERSLQDAGDRPVLIFHHTPSVANF